MSDTIPAATAEDIRAIPVHSTVAQVVARGVRFGTLIDIGCADGVFGLNHVAQGTLAGTVVLNIDANGVYRGSLEMIREAIGGHYLIAAVSDHDGTIEITPGAVAYWDSVRPAGDAYWQKLNNLARPDRRRQVPCRRLDAIVAELRLPPPFLIKLDVQGSEAAVFRGAAETLARTTMVVCEADVDDFQELNQTLVAAGFVLFDLTWLQRGLDQVLRWFYPVYLRREVMEELRASFWPPERNDSAIRTQVDRRARQVGHVQAVVGYLRKHGRGI